MTKLEQLRSEINEQNDWLSAKADEAESTGKTFDDEVIREISERREKLETLKREEATLSQCAAIKAEVAQTNKASKVFGAPGISIKRSVTPQDHNDAFRAWALYGTPSHHAIRDSWKRSADRVECDFQNIEFITRADNTSDVDTQGAEFLSGSVAQRLVEARKHIGGILGAVYNFTTSPGVTVHVPTNDDTENLAVASAQLQEIDDTHGQAEFVYDKSAIVVRDFKTGTEKVSLQLIEDAQFDLVSHITKALSTRLRNAIAESITTGTASSVTSTRGYMADTVLGSTAQVNVLTPDDIYDLYFSVDKDYRDDPSCVWTMSDATLKMHVKQLVDDAGSPVWGPGLNGAPDGAIMQKNIVINNYMAGAGTNGNKAISFGPMHYYWLQSMGGPRLLKSERHIESLAMGFFAWERAGGQLVDPGNGPVRHMLFTTTGT